MDFARLERLDEPIAHSVGVARREVLVVAVEVRRRDQEYDEPLAYFKVGDRVVAFHYEGCRTCNNCRSGWTQMCDGGVLTNDVIIHGGQAPLMRA